MFNEPDQGGDVVLPGAFAPSLEKRGAAGIRLLFQHDPKEPIGCLLNLREDSKGLFVEGELVGDVPRARSLLALMARQAVNGLSIGFRTQKAWRDPHTGHRMLSRIDLWEVSIVTFPMMDKARIFPDPKPPGLPSRSARSPRETIAAAISLVSTQ